MILFAPIIFLIANCADQIVSECSTEQSKTGVIQSSTFTEIQNQILTPSCATTGCHSGSSPAEGLNLSGSSAYLSLVNRKSTQLPDMNRVTPNNSSASYLLQKLEGQNTTVMPPPGKLSAAIIDSIAAWIDAGAKNN